ncbi:MAG TPA: hypothetical protein VFG67_10240 [Oleiagrimonas sp.]|nr:hypothetical protein [Oleiagrimonas sp.]
MNSGEIFVLCLIAIIIVGRIVRQHMNRQDTQPREDPAYRAQLDTLERRVQTLERIVTDKGYDLKREFDKL